MLGNDNNRTMVTEKHTYIHYMCTQTPTSSSSLTIYEVVQSKGHAQDGKVVEDHVSGMRDEVDDCSQDGACTEHAQYDQVHMDQI